MKRDLLDKLHLFRTTESIIYMQLNTFIYIVSFDKKHIFIYYIIRNNNLWKDNNYSLFKLKYTSTYEVCGVNIILYPPPMEVQSFAKNSLTGKREFKKEALVNRWYRNSDDKNKNDYKIIGIQFNTILSPTQTLRELANVNQIEARVAILAAKNDNVVNSTYPNCCNRLSWK